ncbi:protease complex subunit PrcB family protein [Saccharicrinis sp. GN24d3]|uniref:protease complex subunit PrcB family protein n=1 Tax=Saccharicrinis sp. GN24d3 TaxID=3458416 RepID=UPI00403588C1
MLAVIEEIKVTGGYTIKVERLVETNNSIEAIIKKDSPKRVAPTVITQPFFISKINSTDKEIVFNG